MAQSPEQEPVRRPPEGVQERVEEMPEPTPELKEMGVSSVPSQFTGQVTDDTGQQLIQTPQTQTTTITIPASQQQLTDWGKGSPTNALTWLALYWLRMVKKAFHFGWRVVTRSPTNQAQ